MLLANDFQRANWSVGRGGSDTPTYITLFVEHFVVQFNKLVGSSGCQVDILPDRVLLFRCFDKA